MDAPHAVAGPGPAVSGQVALKVTALPDRPGIHASGEISRATCPSWEEALSGLARRHAGVSYVELSDVPFMDVAGVTALALTAMNLPDGRVVVEHPPPQLPRILEMFWPGHHRIEVTPR